MKSIRCRLDCATWCEYFKSGECTSSVKCKYQTEHISVKFPGTIFMPTKEAWEKMQAELARLTAENTELRARLEKVLESPVKIGDKKYMPDCRGIMVLEETVVGVRLSWDETCGVYVNFVEARTQEGVVERFAYDYWQVLYNTYEAAEARLKELQEGKK